MNASRRCHSCCYSFALKKFNFSEWLRRWVDWLPQKVLVVIRNKWEFHFKFSAKFTVPLTRLIDFCPIITTVWKRPSTRQYRERMKVLIDGEWYPDKGFFGWLSGFCFSLNILAIRKGFRVFFLNLFWFAEAKI